MKKHHIGVILTILAVLAAGVFLYYRLGQFDTARFLEVLEGLHKGWLLASLPVILSAYVIRAARWQVMIRPVAPHATLWGLVTSTFIGFMAVVLFGRAGEPVRPFLIAKKLKVSFSSQLAAWFVERILDLLMILALFGFSLAQLSHTGWAPDSTLHTALRAAGWVAGLTGASCLLALIALWKYRGQIRSRLEDSLTFLPEKALGRVQSFIHAFDEGMKLTRDPWSVWLLLISTALEWAVIAGFYYAAMRAFPGLSDMTPAQILTTMGLATFASVVQIPGIGGGMQIAVVLVLTELYGIPVETASAVALLLWALSSLVAVPLGFLFAFREGMSWRTMKEIEQEASHT